MGHNAVLKEILREYERDRDDAFRLLRRRKEEVYLAVPRIQEIDDEMTTAGLSLAKAVLAEVGTDGLIRELEKKNAKLRVEKERLLKKKGYPEDFFTNIYKCGFCRDTGYEFSDLGTVPAESMEESRKCRCLKQKLINKYYDLSNLSRVLAEENFDTFDIRYYSNQAGSGETGGISQRQNMQVIYKNCCDFVDSFGRTFTNLLFYGKTGLGKTFLCNCVAKDLLDLGKTVLYVTAPQLFKMIENYRFNRDEMEEPQETVDLIYTVDLLIIDDLGTEFSTVVTSTELFNIINTRLLEKRPVIISTNLNPVDFENQYSDRMTSRFFGHYKMMKFIGDDIRILKKYNKLA